MFSIHPRDIKPIPTALPGVTLRVPVVQAPLGCCGSHCLAASVSRSGGLGTFSAHNPNVAVWRSQLRRIRALTAHPVMLAFTAQWETDAILNDALAAGFRLFHVFWWNGPRLAPRIQRGGGHVYWQVGTIVEARDAVEMGASALVAQGTEAGGQVRSPRPVLDLVRELREAFGVDLPIIAGGGFADGRDTQDALDAGANAAFFGTRFLLSEEARAPVQDKARLLRANTPDLHLDTRVMGDWPCSPRRQLASAREREPNPARYAGLGIGRMTSVLPARTILLSLAPRTDCENRVRVRK